MPPILIAEDSDEDFDMTYDALRRAGVEHPIERAVDGQAALARLRDPGAPRPAMLLLDLNLPGVDGRQVLRAVREDDGLAGLTVAVLTTSSNPVDIAACASADVYCTKPFGVSTFRAAIAEIARTWLRPDAGGPGPDAPDPGGPGGPGPSAPGPDADGSDAARPLVALLVDDAEADRQLMRWALLRGSDQRYTFVEADTVDEALDVLARPGASVDVVLLDLVLPGRSGLDLLRAVAVGGLPPVPVVVITGSGPAGAAPALALGAQDYVEKDLIGPDVVTRAVRHAIERHRLLAALRAAERAAARRHDEIEATYASAPVGLAVMDLDLRYVRVNAVLAEINGRPASAHLGRTMPEVFGSVGEALVPLLRQLLATGIPIVDREITGELPERPGEARVWLANYHPLRDAAGAIAGVNVVVQEVTALREREHAIRRREAHARGLFEGNPDCVELLDAAGRRLRINENGRRLLGLDASEAGQSEAEWAAGWPAPRPVRAAVRAATRGATGRFEALRPARDGAPAWWDVAVTRVPGVAVDETNLLAVAREITKQRAASDALLASEQRLRALADALDARVSERTAELARSNRELDRFAFVASHDLRAPLRAVASLAAWIAADAADVLPPESARHLAALQQRIVRMERLLADLLAFARAGEAGGLPETVDTRALVEAAGRTVAPAGGLDLRIDDSLPVLDTFRVPLEAVFRNLLDNAVRHHDAPAAGVVSVTAAAAADPAFVTFSVADDGPGIAAADRERVFGLLQTLRPADETGGSGSGIGLAFVRAAVEARGGRVWVEGRDDDPAEAVARRGTTIRFTWPRGTAAPVRRRARG